MTDQLLKTLAAADKILAIAEDALAGLELSTKRWPPEFRAIVWEAVASIATKRAEADRAVVGSAS